MSGIIRKYHVEITARNLGFFLDRGDERLDMNQPYQRGEVWGIKRKRNLIKSLLMGVPIPAIVVNDRFAAGFRHPGYDQERNWATAIVDGKQRVTAFRQFYFDEFSVPAEWFEDGATGEVLHRELSKPSQLGYMMNAVAVAAGKFKTLQQEQELFDLINFGGLAQGEVDADPIPAVGQ